MSMAGTPWNEIDARVPAIDERLAGRAAGSEALFPVLADMVALAYAERDWVRAARFRGLYLRHWRSRPSMAAAGYADSAGTSDVAAANIIDRLDAALANLSGSAEAQAAESTRAPAAVHLPARLPHLAVRIAGILLRQRAGALDFGSRVTALRGEAPESRAQALATLFWEADEIDRAVQMACLNGLLEAREVLVTAGRGDAAARVEELLLAATAGTAWKAQTHDLLHTPAAPSAAAEAGTPAPPEVVERFPMSEKARRFFAAHDWLRLAAQLQIELDEIEWQEPDGARCRTAAARLASALNQCVDFVPHQAPALAAEVYDLAERYGGRILEDARATDDAVGAASNANNLGWAAVSLSHRAHSGGDVLLEAGTQLLEAAVLLAPRGANPLGFSIYANNLAMACRSKARLAGGGDREQYLARMQRSIALMREVIDVDEGLRQSADPRDQAAGATLYLDYANLGRSCFDLAAGTYDAQWINHKPVESARWYRQALDAFVTAARLALDERRGESAADAEMMAARVLTQVCEHYALERYWAGGDLTAAFYRWLCEFAGEAETNPRELVRSSAAAALGYLDAALPRALQLNPGVVLEILDAIVAVWSLSVWRDAVPEEIGGLALASAAEAAARIEDAGMDERFPGQLPEVRELGAYWTAHVAVLAYQRGMAGARELAAARRLFDQLSQSDARVVRSLARPWRDALDYRDEAGGVVLNGLFLGLGGDGLELRVLSNRRSVRLDGLTLASAPGVLRPVPLVRSESATSVAHLQAMMHWEDLPRDIAAIDGRGSWAGAPAGIRAVRLPLGSWECWLLTVTPDAGAEGGIRISLPFLGVYDREHGRLSRTFPARLEWPSGVLLFGAAGVTLEISRPNQEGMAALRVDGTASDPVLHAGPGPLSILLKTTPRVVPSDVAFIVRDDGQPGGLCTAAEFTHRAPSLTFPGGALHSHSPLFFFQDAVPGAAVEAINTLAPRQIVLVGCPPDADAAAALVLELFDPRREILWLVEEAERAGAEAAVATALRTFDAVPGARALLRSAASGSHDWQVAERFQLVCVDRGLAGAAAQMALDMAALRRHDVESVPVAVNGAITYLNVKGNPLAARSAATLFRTAASWAESIERYRTLQDGTALGTPVMVREGSEHLAEVLQPRVPARPVFLYQAGTGREAQWVPQARAKGALLLPAGAAASQLLDALRPDTVFAETGVVVPEGPWRVVRVPEQPGALARELQQDVRARHRQLLAGLEQTHPHLAASGALLEEMEPGAYVVLGLATEAARAWGFVAANYAASMHAPLYLVDVPADLRPGGGDHELDGHARAMDLVRGDRRRQLSADAGELLPPELRGLLAQADADLLALAPRFIGFVSSVAGFPIELAGSPAMATRYAIGRLAGPDLLSTCLLVTRAALGEDVPRPARLRALVVESHDALPERVLPGARDEADALDRLLRTQPDVDSTQVRGSEDRSRFLEEAGDAHLVHFAGHGWYDANGAPGAGLVFREGRLGADEPALVLRGLPIVFANACETGRLGTTVNDGWTGLAATFIARGAVNYLGSLWPIFDEGSRRVAERFYEGVCRGETVGEALRQARLDALDRHDATWAAFVLFGCPRTRLRAPAPPPPADTG